MGGLAVGDVWPPTRPDGSIGRVRLVGIAAAAVAAGLAIALLEGGALQSTGGTRRDVISLPRLPSAASVGKAMLTAFSAVNDDVLYSTQAGTNRGVTVDVYQDWAWPAQPVPGGGGARPTW
jgi:hypothetical protein